MGKNEAKQRRGDFDRRYRCVLLWLLICSVTGAVALIVSSFKIQVLEHSRWLERYDAQIISSTRVPPSRRDIVDRQGRKLALTVMQPSVYADPAMISDVSKTARTVASLLSVPTGAVLEKLNKKKRFVWIKRNISDVQARSLISIHLPGIHVIYEQKRFYPMKTLAGQLLGFVGTDGHGLEGVEKHFDRSLIIKARSENYIRDALGRRILDNGNFVDPQKPLALTIDCYIQRVAENAVAEAAEKYSPESAQVVVMDPATFEVLAVANWPFFDPNVFYAYPQELRKNRAFLDLFEPGSSVKPLLAAAVLEENLTGYGDIVFCENGYFHVPGHTIKDVHPHGWLTVSQIIKYSSNIGAAKLALQLGAQKYHEYLSRFGFGKPTGIEFPGEVTGILRNWKLWRPVDLATSAFGQGIAVTALQLCAAFATIANGGVRKTPTLVITDRRQDGNKDVYVISPRTALTVTRMLVEVTSEGGTGIRASVPGYTVAGKTGTAQRIDHRTGKYSNSEFSSIFAGFAPAENPRIVVAVVIHSPKGASYGGIVAAPVFRSIVAKVLPYLGVPNSIPAQVASCAQKRNG